MGHLFEQNNVVYFCDFVTSLSYFLSKVTSDFTRKELVTKQMVVPHSLKNQGLLW